MEMLMLHMIAAEVSFRNILYWLRHIVYLQDGHQKLSDWEKWVDNDAIRYKIDFSRASVIRNKLYSILLNDSHFEIRWRF